MLLSPMLLAIKIRWIVIKGDVPQLFAPEERYVCSKPIYPILALQMKLNLLIG